MNQILDYYFQGKNLGKTKMAYEIMSRITEIRICQEFHIPYASSINELETTEYRFLSLYTQKKEFWKAKQNKK